MGIRAIGNPPIYSTQAVSSNASTSTLLAQITGLVDGMYEAYVVLGCSTIGTFQLEQILSTGLGDTALRTNGARGELGRVTIYTAADQTAEYLFGFSAQVDDSVRVRLGVAITGGEDAAAKIRLERLA